MLAIQTEHENPPPYPRVKPPVPKPQLHRERRGLAPGRRRIPGSRPRPDLPGTHHHPCPRRLRPRRLTGRTHLRRAPRPLQLPRPNGPQYLVRPQLFSAQELKLYSRPLGSRDAGLDEWLAESGGIYGEPRGIHADCFQPTDRVIQALEQILQARP